VLEKFKHNNMPTTLKEVKEIDNLLRLLLVYDTFNETEYEIFFIDDLVEKSELSKEKVIEYLDIAYATGYVKKHIGTFENSYQAKSKLKVLFKNGGFEGDYKRQKQEHNIKSQKNQPTIVNKNISIVGDVHNSPIVQDSDLRESEFHQIEKKYPNNPAATTQKPSTIFQKIYNLTNHQVIGGIIGGLILTFLLWYFKWK
jgi:hypothetical protein